MRQHQLEKYDRYLHRKRFVTRALLVILAILLILISLTYYGVNVGNFVLRIEDDRHAQLALSIDEDENYTNRLVAATLDKCTDADISMIPNNIHEGLGSKNDKHRRYFAYSFYVVNVSDLTCNYSMDINILRCTQAIDTAIRFMIIYDNNRTIYAKDNNGEAEPIISRDQDNIIGYTTPFLSTYTILSVNYYDLMPKRKDKFTIVMWIDGWDVDESNSMFGGLLQSEVIFTTLQ